MDRMAYSWSQKFRLRYERNGREGGHTENCDGLIGHEGLCHFSRDKHIHRNEQFYINFEIPRDVARRTTIRSDNVMQESAYSPEAAGRKSSRTYTNWFIYFAKLVTAVGPVKRPKGAHETEPSWVVAGSDSRRAHECKRWLKAARVWNEMGVVVGMRAVVTQLTCDTLWRRTSCIRGYNGCHGEERWHLHPRQLLISCKKYKPSVPSHTLLYIQTCIKDKQRHNVSPCTSARRSWTAAQSPSASAPSCRRAAATRCRTIGGARPFRALCRRTGGGQRRGAIVNGLKGLTRPRWDHSLYLQNRSSEDECASPSPASSK